MNRTLGLWLVCLAGFCLPWLAVSALAGDPRTVDARTACGALLKSACERQQACPGCAPPGVSCSALVAAELPACERRAAGASFDFTALHACVQAFDQQPCPLACESYRDPEVCRSFAGLSADP